MYEVHGHTFILGQNKVQHNSELLMRITVVYLEKDTALRTIHYRTGLRASNSSDCHCSCLSAIACVRTLTRVMKSQYVLHSTLSKVWKQIVACWQKKIIR